MPRVPKVFTHSSCCFWFDNRFTCPNLKRKDQEGSLLKVSKYLRSIRLLLCAKSSSLQVDGWAQSLKLKRNWLHAMVMSYAMVLSGLEHVKICHNGMREFGSRCGILRMRKISWLPLEGSFHGSWWTLWAQVPHSCGPMGELWVMVTNQELQDDPAVETPKLPSVELQDHTSARSRFMITAPRIAMAPQPQSQPPQKHPKTEEFGRFHRIQSLAPNFLHDNPKACGWSSNFQLPHAKRSIKIHWAVYLFHAF